MRARALIIKGNPDMCELMMYLLKAFGHSVQSAPDGGTGLESARDELRDIII